MTRVVALVLLHVAWLAIGPAAAPVFAQQELDAARSALRSGSYDEAISAYTRLARDGSSAEATRGLVKALAEVGRYDDAEAAARRFIAANSDSPEVWHSLGEVLVLQGERDEAEDAFERAIAGRASDSLVARLNLAILWYDRGDRSRAMDEFDRFIDVYNRGGDLSSAELTAVATAVRYLGVNDPQLYKDALRVYDEAIAADPGNLEPRVRVGELFLEKYVSEEAAAAFEDVLAINPSHPRALVGMARRMRFDGDSHATELLERSLEVNANFVPALTFRSELLLELENYEAAAGAAERALEVNPASLEALAALGATRYLQGNRRGYEEALGRALVLNPMYADFFNTLADLSARNRLYARAVEFAQRAVELDPESWRGYALLGINQLRTGDIDEGRANLEKGFRGNPYDVWTKNTLDLLDTFSEYDETQTRRFIFMIDGKESELLSIYFDGLADEAYDRLASRYGYQPSTPIRIEVYRSHADFSVRTVGLVGMGALGVSFGPVIAMDSPSAREVGDFNWGSTLWHELAHTFHLSMTEYRVPRWFSEGLAVYEERRARQGWGDDVSPSFLAALQQDRLLAVGVLNNGFARPTYPEQVIHSYYEASLVCELIEQEAGPQAITDMLEAYGQGMTTAEVFRNVLQTDVDDFSERFFDYMEERFAVPLAALRPDRQAARGDRPSRDDIARWATEDEGDFLAQLAYGHVLYEDGDLEAAVPYLEQAKALFPEYAGAGSAYWYLALIHRRRGSLEEAAAELEALTAINARDYGANLELAEVLEERGRLAGAAAALDRTVYIYPYDMALHARLADLYSRTGNHSGAVLERRAVIALDPVDRAEALYQLSRAYFRADDLANARRAVLSALEDAPNFEAAQDLLLEIRAAAGGGR